MYVSFCTYIQDKSVSMLYVCAQKYIHIQTCRIPDVYHCLFHTYDIIYDIDYDLSYNIIGQTVDIALCRIVVVSP